MRSSIRPEKENNKRAWCQSQKVCAYASVAICSIGPAGQAGHGQSARTRRNTCRALPCLVCRHRTQVACHALRVPRRARVSPPQRFTADSLNAKVMACRSPRYAVDAASVSCNVVLLYSTLLPTRRRTINLPLNFQTPWP